MKAVIGVLLLLCVFCNDSVSTSERPHARESFVVDSPQNQGTCTYTLTMRTSCLSSSSTRDQISLTFGDAYGNQVYIPRLDNPNQRTFTRCATDTFQLTGPCTYQICYVYIYRRGTDGLRLKRATIQGYNMRPVTFEYHANIPSGVWFGFNHCQSGGYKRATYS
ncbi:hypothetical protein MLD38_030673 [Melastoma candidum]|uniref:Uncharacterized protein n=1 Tax=Melastoma candidum TaxID=119954 RepID=A0ACB9MMG6_9MYRT|nr:hypothetical protein MLD38_030673 [Melastoma candidum]